MKNLIEASCQFFPDKIESIHQDSVIYRVALALKSENDYLAVKRIIDELKPTPFAIQMLIPCLIFTIVLQKKYVNDEIRQLKDMPNLEALLDLLKFCKQKGYQFDTHAAALVMRVTPIAMRIYHAIGFDVASGVSPTKGTAFHVGALSKNYVSYFKLGIELGADPNQKQMDPEELDCRYDNTAMHLLIANEGYQMLVEFVNRCIAAGRNLDLTVKDREGKNPLVLAAKMRDKYSLIFLVRKWQERPDLLTVDFAACDNDGRNGLHYGCMYKHANIIKLFLKFGADAQQKDCHEKRPLEYLVMKNKKYACLALKSVSIDPNRQSLSSEFAIEFKLGIFSNPNLPTSLINICFSEDSFLGAALMGLHDGLFPSQKDCELIFRNLVNTRTDRTEAMDAFLEKGVDINASGTSGNSALHVAARAGNVAHVQWLINHGATLQSNAKGESPLDVCKDSEILNTLEETFHVEHKRSTFYV